MQSGQNPFYADGISNLSGQCGMCVGARREYREKEREFGDSGKYTVFVKIRSLG
jgi:hypothetical protein